MIILILLLLIFILTDFLINRKIITPGFIFNGIFFVTLCLYELRLSDIQTDLLLRTKICLWIAVLLFNIVILANHFFHKRPQPKNSVCHVPKSTYGIPKNYIKNIRIFVIIFYIIQVVYSRGIPLIWKITGSNLTYFDFGIPSLTGAFYGLVIIIGAYTLFQRGIDKYIYLGIGISIISRQLIIGIVLEGLVFKIFTARRQIKHLILKILLLAIVAIIGFSVIGNFRTGEESFLNVAGFKAEYEWIPTSFKWVYSYMTFSLSNFNKLVSLTNGFENFGASAFNALMPTVLSELLHLHENSYFFLVVNNFTVSTYLPELYLDFGLLGVGFFSVFLGFLGNGLYRKFINTENCKYAMFYSVFAHNVILLFFTNMFLYLPVLIQFLYIPFIFKNCSQRKHKFLEIKMENNYGKTDIKRNTV